MSSISKSSIRKSGCPTYLGVVGLGMTVLRIALSFICVQPISSQNSNVFVAAMVFFIMVFDIFDGKLFRSSSLNESDKWRKIRRILDSCGDRLCIQLVCIPLIIACPSFIPFYCLICLKEILVATVCIHSFINGYIIYPSNISRLSTFFVGLIVISYLLNGGVFTIICAGFLLMGSVLSFSSYIKKTFEINKGKLEEGDDYEILLRK